MQPVDISLRTVDPNQVPSPHLDHSTDYGSDIRRVWYLLIERFWILALALVVCLALGALYLRNAPVLYSSTATLQIEQQERVLKMEDLQTRELQSLDFLQTVAQSLKSRALLDRVVEKNGLDKSARLLPVGQEPVTRAALLDALDKMITVKLRRGTRLIDVTLVSKDPGLTASIANALIGEYISAGAERYSGSESTANEFLNREAERLRLKLKESEHTLQAYKEQSKSATLDGKQSPTVTALNELNTKLTEAKSARIKAEVVSSQVLNLGTNIQALLTLPSVAADQAVIGVQLSLARADTEFAALKQRYKEKHPKYVQAISQIKSLQSDLDAAVLKVADTVKANQEAAKAAEDALTVAFEAQETSTLEMNKLAIEYGALAREVQSDRALYESVLNRMKETSVTKELKPNVARVVQPAYVPEKPFSPRKPMIMGLSGVLGLGIGVVLVFLIGLVDSSVKTVDAAESTFRLPVLTTITQVREVSKGGDALVVVENPQSLGAEAFRTLRATLSTAQPENRRVFLFTSALPHEGKSFCSLNYAASLAQVGLKTLLIDCDLRCPSFEFTLLGKEAQSLGVTEHLKGHKDLGQVIQGTRVDNLFFVPAGSPATNPAELLARGGLGALIQQALQDFDRVVIDSPPIHAVSDTLLMVRHVQSVCLVVRANKTPAESVQRCIQLLHAAGAPLSGAILNWMPLRSRLRRGYNTYYDYAYHGKYRRTGVYGTKGERADVAA